MSGMLHLFVNVFFILLRFGVAVPSDYAAVHFLTLSNTIFLPTAYSPTLICFGRERGW
jgi:hypothetical protein